MAYGNSVVGFLLGANGCACSDCLSINNTGSTSDGFQVLTSYGNQIINCTSYGNGRHGFFVTTGTGQLTIVNCYAEANTAYGYSVSAAFDALWLLNCGGGVPTSGNVNTSLISPDQYAGFITTNASVSSFTNAASGDFSINNTAGAGALLRAAGLPGANASNALLTGASTQTNSYLDIGAAQSQSTGGSTGGLLAIPMTGGIIG